MMKQTTVNKLHRAVMIVFLFMLFYLLAPVEQSCAAQSGAERPAYVTDLANVLTNNEEAVLTGRAEEIAERWECGVYVITVPEYTDYGSNIMDVAGVTYQQQNLGVGENRDGILLLLSLDDRMYTTYVYGTEAEYAFDSYALQQLEGEFLDDFAQDAWMRGFENYYETAEEYLARAAEGKPVRRNRVPFLILMAAAAFLISFIVCSVLKSKSKSVHKSAEAQNYLQENLELTLQTDRFDHMTQTRKPIAKAQAGSSQRRGQSSSAGGGGRSGKF